MPFCLISGERGVGKSLALSERVYNHSKNHDFVVTNFTHAFSNLDCSHLTPLEFIEMMAEVLLLKDAGFEMCDIFPKFDHTGVYFAIDEGTLYFSQELMDRMKKDNAEHYDTLMIALTQARKYDIDCDIVVQDPAKIGKDIRRFVDYYVRYRWLFKFNLTIKLPHPSKPTNRREWRGLIPIVWEEDHNLDVDRPTFNYKKNLKDNSWSEKSTVISRRLKITGKSKNFYYKMYNSYQRLAIGKEEFPGVKYLKSFRYVPPDTYKKEYFPTFKKLLRFMGSTIEDNDQHLPVKYYTNEILLPKIEKDSGDIVKVQKQVEELIDGSELRRLISRAYSALAQRRVKAQS